jgi:hypothetical protein
MNRMRMRDTAEGRGIWARETKLLQPRERGTKGMRSQIEPGIRDLASYAGLLQPEEAR